MTGFTRRERLGVSLTVAVIASVIGLVVGYIGVVVAMLIVDPSVRDVGPGLSFDPLPIFASRAEALDAATDHVSTGPGTVEVTTLTLERFTVEEVVFGIRWSSVNGWRRDGAWVVGEVRSGPGVETLVAVCTLGLGAIFFAIPWYLLRRWRNGAPDIGVGPDPPTCRGEGKSRG